MLRGVIIDGIGLMAGVFVILAFYSLNHRRLRTFAIISNILFILYAIFEALLPVLVLHVILLPLNFVRLRSIRFGKPQDGSCAKLRQPGE